MKKDTGVFLRHILESIEKIGEYTIGVSEQDFLRSAQLQDAVIRRLEIIGEATKNLPIPFRKKYPSTPWGEIARTRDKLIHGYFGVDLMLTWGIVRNDLPGLKEQVKRILKETESK